MLTAVIVLGVLGLIFAALLGLAADYFKTEEDPRLKRVMAILPGTNCGACGSAGCANFAERLLKGEVPPTGCVAGGAEVAAALAKELGLEVPIGVCQKTAIVHCGANEKQRKKKANYFGVKSCAAAGLVSGGGLLCGYGCLGYGDCFQVCPFDAIRMVDGLPVIDHQKCTACGKCVPACPRKIIELVPCDLPVFIACASKDKGAETRKICPVGCIACKICEKEVPTVFKVEDNLAKVDCTQKGINCQVAIDKCPTRCIAKF